MAQTDASGNVNVSRFGPKLAGAGGFINISQNARKVVFVGTFKAGGLDINIEAGGLQINQEGKAAKFVEKVEQVTFSGDFAREKGQQVLYVTERCVFELTAEGMMLTEIAPGIDLQKDILDQMDFQPIVKNPKRMDGRIFIDMVMGLEASLLSMSMDDRITYDGSSNTMFLNFEGLHVRTQADVEKIQKSVEAKCKAIGKNVKVVVNYDSFIVDEAVLEAYVAMVQYMVSNYYDYISRYTTGAFMRMKLGEVLETRGVAPHIFETKEEARRYIGDQS